MEEEEGKPVAEDDEKKEYFYGDEMEMPGQKFDANNRQTVRNLRIREDTAKVY